MKTDRYTKIILTIIAGCMVINVLEKIDIIPSAYANETATATTAKPAPMDVNIVGIRTNDDLDVNVNLARLGGSSIYGEVPVRVKQ